MATIASTRCLGKFLGSSSTVHHSWCHAVPLHPRRFSTCHISLAAKKAKPSRTGAAKLPKASGNTARSPHPVKPTTLSKPTTTPGSSSSASQSAQFRTIADILAARSSPTILYQAPSHSAYIIGSYVSGFFCLSYAGYHFIAHYMQPPPDLPGWVTAAFGIVCFGMTCMGTWLLLAPSKLIRSIAAVPIRTSPPSVKVEIGLRRWLPIPFLKPRVVHALPAKLSLNPRLHVPAPPRPRPSDVLREEQRQLEYEREHLFSAPFRHFGQALKHGFNATRRVWTREGFSHVRVQGQKGIMKLDRQGGWALDEGKALDRLLNVKTS
ncbi:MAG: hypothetical protein M1825_004180 [Sarcosagium campestre]|nr:MAG: hypothetical protein M1825_004180 [Sarcosagium campestre]